MRFISMLLQAKEQVSIYLINTATQITELIWCKWFALGNKLLSLSLSPLLLFISFSHFLLPVPVEASPDVSKSWVGAQHTVCILSYPLSSKPLDPTYFLYLVLPLDTDPRSADSRFHLLSYAKGKQNRNHGILVGIHFYPTALYRKYGIARSDSGGISAPTLHPCGECWVKQACTIPNCFLVLKSYVTFNYMTKNLLTRQVFRAMF